MHRILQTFMAGFVFLPALLAQNSLHSSTLTFSAGGEAPTPNYFGESTGPVFTGNYEFRVWKYLALEAGVTTMLPRTQTFEVLPVFTFPPGNIPPGNILPTTLCANGCVSFLQPDRTRVTLVPFGAKGILPLWSNRLELFAGAGGAYAFHADGRNRNAMLVQGSLGGRVALDQGHHFWLGASGHYFTNFGSGRQAWTTWSADLSIRFGH